jgi:hypothetical protein
MLKRRLKVTICRKNASKSVYIWPNNQSSKEVYIKNSLRISYLISKNVHEIQIRKDWTS